MHLDVGPEGGHYLGRLCIVAAQWGIRGTVGTNGIRIGRPLQGECRVSLRPETITNQRWPVPGHCTIRDSIYEIVYLVRSCTRSLATIVSPMRYHYFAGAFPKIIIAWVNPTACGQKLYAASPETA